MTGMQKLFLSDPFMAVYRIITDVLLCFKVYDNQ